MNRRAFLLGVLAAPAAPALPALASFGVKPSLQDLMWQNLLESAERIVNPPLVMDMGTWRSVMWIEADSLAGFDPKLVIRDILPKEYLK